MTPTTIISGFLGSGKTTIISHLIDTLQKRGTQVAYIKNEIGETDIDGQVMAGKNITTKELLNGCICCTLVGSFSAAITEIVETYHPDRIIIEASGAADPAALALTVDSHPLLKRDGVIGIIDVVNFEGYKDLSITAQNQTKFVDFLVFNKIELADNQHKEAVVGYVRELNTHSPILEAPKGIISPDLLFGVSSTELTQLLATYTPEATDHHTEEDHIHALTIKTAGSYKKETLLNLLNNLPKTIFRAKGLVFLEDEKKYLFNTVGSRTDFQPIPDSVTISENVFVFIGWEVEEVRGEIEEKLKRNK